MDAALHDPGPGRLNTPAAPTDLLRVEVTVPLGLGAAFALLTEGLDGWWPTERRWGEVTLREPPLHLRASWPGVDGASVVDVRLADVDDDLTTVIVEHRGLHHHSPEERAWLRGDDGWWAILRTYAAAARTAPT